MPGRDNLVEDLAKRVVELEQELKGIKRQMLFPPSSGGVDGNTAALLHFNGANGSTSFTDASGKTWTPTGLAHIDTSQFKFGGASGVFQAATADTIVSADTDDWRLDNGSNADLWTVDFWTRFNGDPGVAIQGFLQQRQDDNNFWAIRLSNNLLSFLVRSGGANIVVIEQAFNPATATWYHIAIVKNGVSGYMHFVDGVQTGATTLDVSPMPNYSASLVVGDYFFGAVHNYFNGWMDELRISKGVARWTANFTPPIGEY